MTDMLTGSNFLLHEFLRQFGKLCAQRREKWPRSAFGQFLPARGNQFMVDKKGI
jgi:hypothetical protein